MPSIIRSMAVAAFASFAAAQYSNGTAPAAVSVAGWTYQGCAVATAATGALLDSSASMTVERCLLAASAYGFARIQGNNCYGASSTNGTSAVAELSCNTRCPGNAAEACGGSAGSTKRQAVGTTVSVYARTAAALISVGTIYNVQINNIYIDYCASCLNGAGQLVNRTYQEVVTVTACGCTSQVTPTVSVVTVTTPCTLSGTATVLTLTVPAGVTVGTATVATVTAPVVTVVACASCAATTATVGTTTVTVPAGSALTTVTYCPGCATGSGTVTSTATAVVGVAPTTTAAAVASSAVAATTTTRSTQYTGAASVEKASFGLLALGAAAVLL